MTSEQSKTPSRPNRRVGYVGVDLDPADKRALRIMAAMHGHSLSDELRDIVHEAVRRAEEELKEATA